MGAGISGQGAARLLVQHGYQCTFFDERQQLSDTVSDPALIRPERFRAVVVSPGFAPTHPAIRAAQAAGIPLFSEVEIAIAHSTAPYIGVTGSNGKTTTTALLAHLLQAQGENALAVGNIGEAFCEALLEQPHPDRFVVEFSSYQLENFEPVRPAAVAVLLNISPDHLERHGTLERYIDAKFNLARQAETLVYNADDPALELLPTILPELPCITFGINNPQAQIQLHDDIINTGIPLSTAGYQLKGEHNLLNVMAALATCRLLGYDPERVNRAVAAFTPLPHRLEPLATINGIAFINDSKATNEDAVNYALKTFPDQSVHLLAGGIVKTDDLSSLRKEYERSVIQLYLFGRDRDRILKGLGNPTNVSLFDSMAEALAAAAATAAPGQKVLLSPMGASFDQFKNFEDRGDHFRELVRQLDVRVERNL